jgi:hypothetical protein
MLTPAWFCVPQTMIICVYYLPRGGEGQEAFGYGSSTLHGSGFVIFYV